MQSQPSHISFAVSVAAFTLPIPQKTATHSVLFILYDKALRENILSFTNNYGNIRKRIKQCIEKKELFIPHIAVYTSIICYLQEKYSYIENEFFAEKELSAHDLLFSLNNSYLELFE